MTRAGPSIGPDGEIMYSAGIVLDHENPEIVYLARKKRDWFQVEAWKTNDRGRTWNMTPITSAARHHMRPVSPRSRTGRTTIQVLFMERPYNSYTTYRTDVVLTNRRWA